jgi:hypothetical protein
MYPITEIFDPLLTHCDIQVAFTLMQCSKHNKEIVQSRVNSSLACDTTTPIVKVVKMIKNVELLGGDQNISPATMDYYKAWATKMKARDTTALEYFMKNTDMLTCLETQNLILDQCFPLAPIGACALEKQTLYTRDVNIQVEKICRMFIACYSNFHNNRESQVSSFSIIANVFKRYIEWGIRQDIQDVMFKTGIMSKDHIKFSRTVLGRIVYFKDNIDNVPCHQKRQDLLDLMTRSEKLLKAWMRKLLGDPQLKIGLGCNGGVYTISKNGVKKYTR